MNEIVEVYKKTAVNLLKNPDSPEDLSNQFTLLSARGKPSRAQLALAQRCAALAPNEFIAVFNRAGAEMKAGLHGESIRSYMRALELADGKNQPVALQHVGLAWYASGNSDEALKWYERARTLKDEKELHQSIAIANLMRGDLTAMYEFECKYHSPRRKPIAEAGIPRWMGEDLTGKTLIVAHEQGFGDTIQFARFISLLKPAKLIWSGPESISGLIADNFKFDAVVGEDGPFDADYYTSPIAACGAMRIPYSDVDPSPYMTAQPTKLPQRGKLKIGIAWAGNEDYAHDAERSMKLEELMPLLSIPGTAFYSLQVGRGEGEITALGLDGMIANLGGTFKDWRDTARAIAALDLVVSVDSGAAHMAGALGVPVHILLPFANCWRWMRDRTDTPWYSCATLFRQWRPGDWTDAVTRVKEAIEERLDVGRTEAA